MSNDPNAPLQGQAGPWEPSGGYSGYQPAPPQPTDPYSGQYSALQDYRQQNPGQGGLQASQPGYGQSYYPPQQTPYVAQTYASPPGATGTTGPSTLQVAPNILGFLSYLFWPISSILILLLEKQNRFVRFHAFQALFVAGAVITLEILERILLALPILGGIFALVFLCANLIVAIGLLALWIVLMVQAYQGKLFKLPYLGNQAEKLAAQGTTIEG
jgi:uncharacterized membrane protein